jgi:hypothetical protein
MKMIDLKLIVACLSCIVIDAIFIYSDNTWHLYSISFTHNIIQIAIAIKWAIVFEILVLCHFYIAYIVGIPLAIMLVFRLAFLFLIYYQRVF